MLCIVSVLFQFTRALFVFGTPESDEGYFIVGPSSPSPGDKSPGQCQRFSDSPSRTNELQWVGVRKSDVIAKKKTKKKKPRGFINCIRHTSHMVHPHSHRTSLGLDNSESVEQTVQSVLKLSS